MQQSRRDSVLGAWRITVDRYILLAILVAILFSVVMVTTASPAIAERIGLHSSYFIQRQLIFLLVGLGLIFAMSFLSFESIKNLSLFGLFFFLALMFLVLFIGEEIKGAKRWVSLGFIAIQPSEFIKPFFAVITAKILTHQYINSSFSAFKYSTILYLLIMILLILQPDFGMAITISAVWGGQMFLAGLSIIWIMLLSIIGMIGLIAAYLFLPHVAARIDNFLDPSNSDNYQVKKSLEAFSNGGVYGTGPGEGVVKQHLPDSHTDFVFAVIGEELGLFACLIVILLFAFIVIRGLLRVRKVGDIFATIAVSGLLMQIGFQAIINIGVTLHLFPTKGMTLPFISYGGSSIMAVSLTMGIILALTRKRYGIRLNPHFMNF